MSESKNITSGTTDVKKDRKKTIITCALTGASGNKKNNPNTPITPEEIAEDAYRAYKAGAAVVHLHMKGDDGDAPSMEYEKFSRTQQLIREKCDVIINMTTSGELVKMGDSPVMGTFNANDRPRLDILELKPEMATFDVGTLNFGRMVFLNTLPFLETLGKEMQVYGVKTEVECFDVGHVRSAIHLMKSGHVVDPHFQICLGVLGGAGATVENLLYMVNHLPENTTWSAFGIGAAHLPILYTTLALGGHIRVGLEDNLYMERGVLATNEKLVQRAVEAVKVFGNDVATPSEAREILGLLQI